MGFCVKPGDEQFRLPDLLGGLKIVCKIEDRPAPTCLRVVSELQYFAKGFQILCVASSPKSDYIEKECGGIIRNVLPYSLAFACAEAFAEGGNGIIQTVFVEGDNRIVVKRI